ncbi:MAG: matrixin family metalloprotease [Deltaproteobacteria bacterium]|nr:matrixin family metalloprotease [Deltaproteobacteria bacterium]
MDSSTAARTLVRWLTAALVLVVAPSEAAAYCFSSTCGEEQPICVPSEGEPCGNVRHWMRDCVGYALQRNGTASLTLVEVADAARAAFGAWTLAQCDTGDYPGIDVIEMGEVACNRKEFNPIAGNVNVVTFYDADWPYPKDSDALALTWVSFVPSTGEIVDADIEVNTSSFTFSVSGTSTDYDLVGVLTHEVGHFFGMAHSLDQESTMRGDVLPGDTGLRSLMNDDVAGICALYPSKTIDYATCNPIPLHGFASECEPDQYKGSCSAPAGRFPSEGAWEVIAAAIGLGMWLCRRTPGKARPKFVGGSRAMCEVEPQRAHRSCALSQP